MEPGGRIPENFWGNFLGAPVQSWKPLETLGIPVPGKSLIALMPRGKALG